MLKQTLATTRITNIRSVVPLAAPRGLNLEIGSVNYLQDNGTSARTAFVAPFQAGTQNGRGHEDRGGVGIRIRPTARQAIVPPPQSGLRLPARLVRQGAVSNDHTQLCVWGEEGTLDIFWERLSYLFRDSTIGSQVVKVERVQQAAKNRTRFDLWVPERFVDVILGKMGPGRARYGWYFRRHIPFLERVGRCLPQCPAAAPPGSPTATPPPDVQEPPPNLNRGAPLVVVTLNINGLHRKKTDLRVLLQQTRCDIMALQETLLRSSDWQLCLPGYHCFTAMGDLTASQRGMALVVSTRFNCTAVGKATPYWTFARVYGATLLSPLIVGTIYVPCRVERHRVLRALPGALAALHREFPNDPIVLMGDFNMTMTELQLQMGSWDLPFRVLPIRGGGPTRRSRRWGDPTPAIDFITYCGGTRAAVPPAKVLDHWDISDHFPVIADLPGLTRVPERGAIPPPPSTLGRRILVEEKEMKHSVASSNYWQPLADSLEDAVEEALERAQALEDPTNSLQTQLDGMAKKFSDTCHLVADQLDLHQKVGGRAPPRVAARVRRAIEQRRKIFRDLRHAESQGFQEDVARLGEEYLAAQS